MPNQTPDHAQSECWYGYFRTLLPRNFFQIEQENTVQQAGNSTFPSLDMVIIRRFQQESSPEVLKVLGQRMTPSTDTTEHMHVVSEWLVTSPMKSLLRENTGSLSNTDEFGFPCPEYGIFLRVSFKDLDNNVVFCKYVPASWVCNSADMHKTGMYLSGTRAFIRESATKAYQQASTEELDEALLALLFGWLELPSSTDTTQTPSTQEASTPHWDTGEGLSTEEQLSKALGTTRYASEDYSYDPGDIVVESNAGVRWFRGGIPYNPPPIEVITNSGGFGSRWSPGAAGNSPRYLMGQLSGWRLLAQDKYVHLEYWNGAVMVLKRSLDASALSKLFNYRSAVYVCAFGYDLALQKVSIGVSGKDTSSGLSEIVYADYDAPELEQLNSSVQELTIGGISGLGSAYGKMQPIQGQFTADGLLTQGSMAALMQEV